MLDFYALVTGVTTKNAGFLVADGLTRRIVKAGDVQSLIAALLGAARGREGLRSMAAESLRAMAARALTAYRADLTRVVSR